MEIYVSREGAQAGPFPIEEVQKMVAAGQYSARDSGWHEGLKEWVPLSNILTGTRRSTPPPPPPAPASQATKADLQDLPSQAPGVHVKHDGKQTGPFTIEEIKAHLASGSILASDEAWHTKAFKWIPLSAFPEINPQAEQPSIRPKTLYNLVDHPIFGDITTAKHGLKVIKYTAWLYYFVAVINVFLSFSAPPSFFLALLIGFLAFMLQWRKSRVAAGILLALAIIGVLWSLCLMFSGGLGVLVMLLTALQTMLTFQAFLATGKLRQLSETAMSQEHPSSTPR